MFQGDYAGDVYDGNFRNGAMHGKGTYTWADGTKYEGDWEDDKRHGKGTWTWASGKVEVGQYNMGKRIGEGARWSSDRRTAWRLKDGDQGGEISLAEAAQIAGRLGLPVPP